MSGQNKRPDARRRQAAEARGMQAVDPREIVYGMLLGIYKDEMPSHLVLSDTLAKYAWLDKQDRAFITRLTRGVLQNSLYLDAVLLQCADVKSAKTKKPLLVLLYMGAYQILCMDGVPDHAAVDESVRLAGRHGFGRMRGFVNAVLRAVSSKKDSIQAPDPEKDPAGYLAFAYSLPEWIGRMWLGRFGFETCREMASYMQEPARVTVRVRRPEETDAVIKSLADQGVRAARGRIFPFALHLSGLDSVHALKDFARGRIAVQDEGAMLAAVCAGIRGGEQIIDLCAAPGGKSLHMADLLKGSGSVSARDISQGKTDRIEENLRRAGDSLVQTMVWDAVRERPEDILAADIVMADLPCSGLGVLGRKADIRRTASPEKIRSLAALQKEILRCAKEYVKPGGVLVYCTCTVSEEENEKIRSFILADPRFVADSLDPFLPELLRDADTAQGQIQILPGRYGTDGFYVARFRRILQEEDWAGA